MIVTGCSSNNSNNIENEERLEKNVNWENNKTFESNGFILRGTEGVVGFIDEPFIPGDTNKYMWHFWGDYSESSQLIVKGQKKGSKQEEMVLMENNEKVWGLSGGLDGPNNGADFHKPSLMSLPESGTWSLNIYLDDKFIDNIVVEVK